MFKRCVRVILHLCPFLLTTSKENLHDVLHKEKMSLSPTKKLKTDLPRDIYTNFHEIEGSGTLKCSRLIVDLRHYICSRLFRRAHLMVTKND